MKPIEYHPQAVDDYDTSEIFYENCKTGLGDEFRACIEFSTQEIRTNPGSFPIHRGMIRFYLVKRFPFVIY